MLTGAATSLQDRVYRTIAATRFPRVADADAMLGWVGYLRVVVGIVALIRTGLIVEASRFYYDGGDSWLGLVNAHETELALFQFGLLILFTIGLLTPVATLALLVTYPLMDRSLLTETLGTAVFSLLLIFFLLANSGCRVSVDAWLARRRAARGPLRVLYALGEPDARQLTIYLFGLFAAYALMSFGALLHHMNDLYWQAGDTVGVMLTNSYLSRLWEPMRTFSEATPWLFETFSKVTVIFQTIFQLLMLPLVRWRWGLYFVIAWGGMFVLISVIAIQLSYLPFLELPLWALLWVRPRARPSAELLYDDRCNLCRGTVRVLRALDPLRSYGFLPLSTHEDVAIHHGASADAVLQDLHGIRNGRLLRGYDLYRGLARANPVLWPLVPVLELGRVTRIGPLVYGLVARRRRRLLGTCELGGAPIEPASAPAPRQPPAVTATAVTLLGVVSVFFVISFVELHGMWRSLGVKPLPVRVEKWSNDIRYVLGFTAPDVFNIVDLRMGEQWWTARWRAPDGRTGTVPLNEPDGARGPYHTSDSLYFGNSIRWRRGTIGADLEAVNVEGTQPRMLIDLVLRYHRRRHGGSEAWRYDVRFFRTRAADVTVDPPERYDVMSAGGFTTEIEP